MKYILTIITCLGVFFNPIFAQNVEDNRLFSDNINFAQYLQSTQQFDNLVLHFHNILKINTLNTAQKDSIYWGLGLAHYSQKQLDSSAKYLENVSEKSTIFNKSRFFASINWVHLGNLEKAEKVMPVCSTSDSLLFALYTFEKAGLALLKRDFAAYERLSPTIPDFYAIQEQKENRNKYYTDLKKVKKKSPFLAALMSAIIPGSGKIYAGKRGQGIASFLQSTVAGIQAYEGYKKGGIKSPRFIIYGGLFTVFYIGNIWGSSLSVKIKQQEMYDHIDNQILFDMHVPLRTVFNY